MFVFVAKSIFDLNFYFYACSLTYFFNFVSKIIFKHLFSTNLFIDSLLPSKASEALLRSASHKGREGKGGRESCYAARINTELRRNRTLN